MVVGEIESVQTGCGVSGCGVIQLPLASLTMPGGTVAWLPGILGQTSTGGGGVTQLPLASLLIPDGIVA